ncbi:MAG: hypothetical protein KGQ57_09100, partial [Burkholderiales bacterium]|nr:hypothetical protein [Burkholderiales bacterium]
YRGHAVHSMPLWGMGAKAAQHAALRDFDSVVTIEDHLIDGGFGSWMMESALGLGKRIDLDVRALSPVVCGAVGPQNILNALGGVS